MKQEIKFLKILVFMLITINLIICFKGLELETRYKALVNEKENIEILEVTNSEGIYNSRTSLYL